MKMVTPRYPTDIQIKEYSPVNSELSRAYLTCRQIARSHYENFPVASWLLPRRDRMPVSALYAFARTADDFADEGELSRIERLERLDSYERSLREISSDQKVKQEIFIALADSIHRYNLPVEQFRKLLAAFRQDVIKNRYANFQEVLDYCDCSANPVGHILLCLWDKATPENIVYSNAICTSLQLVNFLQDISADYEKGRIYLPQDELHRFGITEADISNPSFGKNWQAFMGMQITRARQMLQSGTELGKSLGGRKGLEISVIIHGGLKVLDLMEYDNTQRLAGSTRLRARDWPSILLTSILTLVR